MSESISPRFLALAKKVLPEQPVICDIGSRDALEGIYLSEHLNASHLHVFEPNPEAAARCVHNLRELSKTSVTFNEVAVADRVGTCTFYAVNEDLSNNKDIGFSSLLRINPEYMKRRERIVQDELIVQLTTLDLYFRDKSPPHFLWVDVEGAELLVLRGAAEVLSAVRLIHIEVSFRPMQIAKPLYWEIEEFLSDKGFAFYGFMEIPAFRGLLYRRHLLPNPPWRLNAVFYRRLPKRNGPLK